MGFLRDQPTDPGDDRPFVAAEDDTHPGALRREESRRVPRWSYGAIGDVRTVGGEASSAGIVENISVGGAFVATIAPLPVDSVVELELPLDDGDHLALRARVLWVRRIAAGEQGPGMGLMFERPLPTGSQATLERLLGTLAGRDVRSVPEGDGPDFDLID